MIWVLNIGVILRIECIWVLQEESACNVIFVICIYQMVMGLKRSWLLFFIFLAAG